MTDLLAEVDDMMRRERMEKLWHDHKMRIIGIVVALILATAAYSAYESWDNGVKMRDTDAIIALTQAPDFPQNIKPDTLNMRPNAKAMTLLIAAKALVAQGKDADALPLYKNIAETKSVRRDIRELGTLMEVTLLSKNSSNKTEDLIEKLSPVYHNENSPWHYHAALQAAILSARKENYKGARELLEPLLKNENLPSPLVAKARALDHIYAVNAEHKIFTKTEIKK